MTLKPIGLAVVAVVLGVPFIWMPPLAAKHDVIALGSQYLGILALLAMTLSQVIATRLGFVEKIFGGLDRSYILHKWLGIGAMAAVLLHDTIDAEMDGLGRETLLVELAETLGEISLYGLLILVVITVATFIPYHLWRWTHKFMGAFFAFSAFHYLFILKPFGNGEPLGLYVGAMCLLGVASYAYTLLPGLLRGHRAYQVSDVTASGRNTSVTLMPKGRSLRYRAGQFVFATIPSMSSEPHPFTISKAPTEDGSLRLTVAPLGDFTSKMVKQVVVGDTVDLEGPYGRFARGSARRSEIWIAAGVGITPFLSWAQTLTDQDNPVTLVYCVGDEADASHLDDLKALEARLVGVSVVLHESTKSGRLTVDALTGYLSGDLSQAQVYFCGPKLMRETLAAALARTGLPLRRFHYEEFEIRSGIGLDKLAAYLFRRMSKALADKVNGQRDA